MRYTLEFVHSGRGSQTRGSGAGAKQKDGSMFWWAIVITLLLGAAIASWFFSIFVFAYPEKPFNYRFLSRINKLDTLKNYTPRDVPSGKVYDAKKIYEQFNRLTDGQLDSGSSLLLRSYITNYKDTEEKPVFLKGQFQIYHVRPLNEKDVFTSGIVVRAQAVEEKAGKEKTDPVTLQAYPNTVIEFVFPCPNPPGSIPVRPGDVLTIRHDLTYASVLHIERLPEEKLLFTVIPLLYEPFVFSKEDGASIVVAPPARLNLDADWPITEDILLPAAVPATVAEVP